MQEEAFISPDIQFKVDQWLHSPFDERTRHDVEKLLHDPQKLIDAFYTNLSFGTAGLRGLMGVGTNRINQYTIGAVTQGLADYIQLVAQDIPLRVAIAFDCRHNSKEFAYKAANVLAANGIEVFLNEKLRPTPFLSFMCRYHGCIAAIMITASHNPPEYNGYKVYWSDGGQVLPPHDEGIIYSINQITNITQVKSTEDSNPLIQKLNTSDDAAYLKALEALQNYPGETHRNGAKLHVVFSNLHGTGITLLPQALSTWGFTHIDYVEKQKEPDGNFPTAKNPNPELKEALTLGISLLQEKKADILIATDPDADRVGVALLHQNQVHLLNGNQIASICLYHLLETFTQQKRLSSNHAAISTIVTTPLLKTLCEAYHIHYFETLTGFKYIGEKIKQFEESPKEYEFLFGAEESYGFLYGTHVRDKDALITSCLLSEIALLQKNKNETLLDLLYTIYKKFGVYQEKQLSITLPEGKQSHKKIEAAMQSLRNNPPKELLGLPIYKIEDYQLSYTIDCITNKKTPLTLPKSNVLIYHYSDQSKCVIRPSGTESKIKIYAMLKASIEDSIPSTLNKLEIALTKILNAIKTNYLGL